MALELRTTARTLQPSQPKGLKRRYKGFFNAASPRQSGEMPLTVGAAMTLVGVVGGVGAKGGYYASEAQLLPDSGGAGNQLTACRIEHLVFVPLSNNALDCFFSQGADPVTGAPKFLLQNNAGTLRFYNGNYIDIAPIEIGRQYVFTRTYSDFSPYTTNIYLDGVLKNTTTGYRFELAKTYLGIGFPAQSVNTAITGFFAYSGELQSDAQVFQDANDPWRLFAPEPRRLWTAPAAGGGAFAAADTEALTLAESQTSLAAFAASLTEAVTLATVQDAVVGFAVTAIEVITLADSGTAIYGATVSASDAMALGGAPASQLGAVSSAIESMALGDAESNVAALSASISEAISLAESESNGSGLAASQSEAMTLADSASNTAALSASATEAMSLADSGANGAGLLASATEAMALADGVSELFAVTASISEAMTLAELDSVQAGNYLASVNEALVMAANSDSSKASAAMQIEAMTLADAASQGGSYVASPTVYGSPARLSSYSSPGRLSSYSSPMRQ